MNERIFADRVDHPWQSTRLSVEFNERFHGKQLGRILTAGDIQAAVGRIRRFPLN